jgi:hypothetical protein
LSLSGSGGKAASPGIIHAASGWSGIVAGGSNQMFMTGEPGNPEYVNITPLAKMGGGWGSPRAGSDSAPTIIIEDHSVLTIQVDPKSGIDQNSLAETLNIIVMDNRQQVVDKMAAALSRKS